MNAISKLIIVNTCWCAFLVYAWFSHIMDKVMKADSAHMEIVIASVFMIGLLSTVWQVFSLGKGGNQEEAVTNSAHLYDIFAALFILGIIGNALGFLNAFGGVHVADMATADGIKKAGVQLLSGVGTAFGSTLAGLTLALWTSCNLRILSTAIDRMER